jgi:hypothetical protein
MPISARQLVDMPSAALAPRARGVAYPDVPDRPLVSIIIANYNFAQFLRQAIESALAQTYRPIEVIVVDDGSTDHSRELLASYDGRISTILKENGGHTSALNVGLAKSCGELIAWLDSDDVMLPHKIERVVAAHQRAPEAVLIYHRLQNVDPAGRPFQRPWPRDLWAGSIRERVARAAGWWPRPVSSGMVFKRRYLERLHPFPEMRAPGATVFPDAYAGDLAPFCGSLLGLPEPLALYRRHPAAEMTRVGNVRQVEQMGFEHRQLEQALQRLGIVQQLAPLARRHNYVQAAFELGQLPLGQAVSVALSCPTLSTRGRMVCLGAMVWRRLRGAGEALS